MKSDEVNSEETSVREQNYMMKSIMKIIIVRFSCYYYRRRQAIVRKLKKGERMERKI